MLSVCARFGCCWCGLVVSGCLIGVLIDLLVWIVCDLLINSVGVLILW